MKLRSTSTSFVLALITLARASTAGLPVEHRELVRDLQAESARESSASSASTPRSKDAPLSEARARLLDLAFSTASAPPTNPHVRNRARLQQTVAELALELDQPVRVGAWAPSIDTWRGAFVRAQLAVHAAEHRADDDADAWIAQVVELLKELESQRVEEQKTQDWQRDRIRVTVARALIALGRPEEAHRFEANIVEAASGHADVARAERATPEGFDAELRMLDTVLSTSGFDETRNALDVCAALEARFYDDAERRVLVEQRILAQTKKIPLDVQIELRVRLARIALEHADPKHALGLTQEARTILASATWSPEDRIRIAAPLAALRFQAGEESGGRSELEALERLFTEKQSTIVDIYRAGALRALAEAWSACREPARVVAAYERAVEEGVRNPNSRPRADDLVATSCSMARVGFEPSPALWEGLERARASLGNPW